MDIRTLIDSLSSQLDLTTGHLSSTTAKRSVTLSSMVEYFADQQAARAILDEEGDRVLYDVAVVEPESTSPFALAYGTTRIYPGTVGDEYHMTKGHYHAEAEAPEVYVGLEGEGGLLLMTEDGASSFAPLEPGAIVYVPGSCAHRMVNTGNKVLVTLAVYPVTAGHDYGSIARRGFSSLVINNGGTVAIVPNERWTHS